MNTEVPFGTFHADGRRYQVRAELRIEPAQALRNPNGRTTEHKPIPPDAVEVSISGVTYYANADGSRDRRYREGISYGQITDDLARVKNSRAARLLELWDRWHLNGMRAGCAHQGEVWKCTNRPAHPTGRNVRNGWPVVRSIYADSHHRGDQCHVCGRNRWDETEDWCFREGPSTPYRFGTAWLYEPVPPEIVAELRRMFGQTQTPPAEAMPRTAWDQVV